MSFVALMREHEENPEHDRRAKKAAPRPPAGAEPEDWRPVGVDLQSRTVRRAFGMPEREE